MVAFDLWDHLGRHVTPMLAVYATATVVVTVAAGTRYLILYLQLLTATAPYLSYCGIVLGSLTRKSA